MAIPAALFLNIHWVLKEFQIEEHESCFKRLIIFKLEKVAFLLLGSIKWFETVLFVKMQGLVIVVCVNNDKSASGFIVK